MNVKPVSGKDVRPAFMDVYPAGSQGFQRVQVEMIAVTTSTAAKMMITNRTLFFFICDFLSFLKMNSQYHVLSRPAAQSAQVTFPDV